MITCMCKQCLMYYTINSLLRFSLLQTHHDSNLHTCMHARMRMCMLRGHRKGGWDCTGSARHLRKVVCSCGRKGLREGPALASRAARVPRIAAFTPLANLSLMILQSAPTTYD